MRVLVTGGAGFIGSHICERLLQNGYEVVCLDNFDPYYDPNSKRENASLLSRNDRFKLIEGDIRDQGLVQEIIRRGMDYVFHYAAQGGVRASVENPLKSHEVNATGTLNILWACVNSNVKKVIYASSSSVYGEVQYLPFDEDHPKTPISPYGVSKLAAEHYCRVFSEVYGLETVSLRLFTVYGPRMRPDLAISIFTRAALENKPIEIFGDGSKTRDFTYIDDVVEANLLAMTKGNSSAYNIGSGSRISIIELAKEVTKITQSKSEVICAQPRSGDAQHTWANVERARENLGWEPKTHIDGGLERFISWQQQILK